MERRLVAMHPRTGLDKVLTMQDASEKPAPRFRNGLDVLDRQGIPGWIEVDRPDGGVIVEAEVNC